MTKIYTMIIMGFMLLFTLHVYAQSDTNTAINQEMVENKALPIKDTEESIEDLNIEELRILERESKLREKEARKENKEAQKLERQIQRTKNAELRAIKARKMADEQAVKTKSAIEGYMKEQ